MCTNHICSCVCVTIVIRQAGCGHLCTRSTNKAVPLSDKATETVFTIAVAPTSGSMFHVPPWFREIGVRDALRRHCQFRKSNERKSRKSNDKKSRLAHSVWRTLQLHALSAGWGVCETKWTALHTLVCLDKLHYEDALAVDEINGTLSRLKSAQSPTAKTPCMVRAFTLIPQVRRVHCRKTVKAGF